MEDWIVLKLFIGLFYSVLWNEKLSEISFLSSAKYNHLRIIQFLLTQNAIDVNFRDMHGRTALLRASKNGNLEIVETLLDAGADVKLSLSGRNFNCFDYAYEYGHDKIMNYLLDHYIIDIDDDEPFNTTVFFWASLIGRTDVVNHLSKYEDIEINSQIWHNLTIQCSYKGNLGKLKQVLEYIHINVNFQDSMGRTALMISSNIGNIDVVERLLECNNIDVNISDIQGHTALMESSERGNIDVVKRLLECNEIDVNIQNCVEETALIIAKEHGHLSIVKLLVDFSKKQIHKGFEEYTNFPLDIVNLICEFCIQ